MACSSTTGVRAARAMATSSPDLGRSQRRRGAQDRSTADPGAVCWGAVRFELGADVVEIAQVARSIATFGQRYLRRVFTDRELAYCTAEGRDPAPHLAARFAAKEAACKALRVGDARLDWRWIEVVRRPDGACRLVLHREMRALARRRGAHTLRVTMSHDGAYAIAVVLGERRSPSRTVWSTGRRNPRRSHRR